MEASTTAVSEHITLLNSTVDKTLPELPSPEICVICLDLLHHPYASLSDDANRSSAVTKSAAEERKGAKEGRRVATAIPCSHAQFHFSCLGTWLNHSQTCPLCKVVVRGISVDRIDDEGIKAIEVLQLPEVSATEQAHRTQPTRIPTRQPQHNPTNRPSRRRRRGSKNRHDEIAEEVDPVLAFRRTLYERQIPCLYRGRGVMRDHKRRKVPIRPGASFIPNHIQNNPNLLRLASAWIRRELLLFPFLEPTSLTPTASSTHTLKDSSTATHVFPPPTPPTSNRRPTTAPFLQNYILLIIQQIDLAGAAGAAVDLIAEYLGKHEAVLFVHELRSFLGSGCASLHEWDEEGALYWFDDMGQGEVRDGTGRVLGRVP